MSNSSIPIAATADTELLAVQSNSLITASLALGYVLTEWTYHLEWENSDIWPRILSPFLATLAALFYSIRHSVRRAWYQRQLRKAIVKDSKDSSPTAANTPATRPGSPSRGPSEKSIPEWALPSQHPSKSFFRTSHKPLNGPEWAYVFARIGSVGCALSALALHTVGNIGVGDESLDEALRWKIPDRNCNAAVRLKAGFNLFALSGSGAIILVRALALHKFRRPFEKPILWMLWGSLQALILVELITISSISTHDGSRFCLTGPNSFSVPNIVPLLPYFLPILSSTLCFVLIARYLIAYRRQNPDAWAAGWTFRLYLRDSFIYWLSSMLLFLPLLVIYIVEQTRLPALTGTLVPDEAGLERDAEIQRWKIMAALNLCTACSAAYACRIFVNLRKCLEHDLGRGAAAGGMGATAYEHNQTTAGPNAVPPGSRGANGGVWATGGMAPSRLRNRSAAAAMSAGAGMAGHQYPHQQYQYPYPNSYLYPNLNVPGQQQPTIPGQGGYYQHPSTCQDPSTFPAHPNQAYYHPQSATTSQPIYHQISRIYGGEQAMSVNAISSRWAAGPMGSGISAGGAGGVGVHSSLAPGAASRVGVQRSFTGGVGAGGPATSFQLQQGQPQAAGMNETASQVQFQLPAIHQQFSGAQGGEGEKVGQQGEGGPSFASGMGTVSHSLGVMGSPLQQQQQQQQQQQHPAAMTGEFLQAMNASGLPFQLAPPATLPLHEQQQQQQPYPLLSQAPSLPERQLVVVQEDWGDTHPDLVFSLNGGLDDDEEEEEMQQQYLQQQQQQQQQYGMGFNHGAGAYLPGMGMVAVPSAGSASMPLSSMAPTSATAQSSVAEAQTSRPNTASSASIIPPPPPSTESAGRDPQDQLAEREEADDDDDDDDGSWMDHPEECECDGCCETDTEASDYVRPDPAPEPHSEGQDVDARGSREGMEGAGRPLHGPR
ncbi:hypothetical protein A4X09_0g1238 [Tilletia walkeri]|uniref:Uncharacterized protein n=1 Tax=Tilletia walkeri TaxID=117179 RepID=A0A8X7NBZ8_9BASI|nr:hypothetical protein A4X09_0g1238 [Tilletia walkeri]